MEQHIPKFFRYRAERGDEAFGNNMPAGEEFPKQEQGDKDGPKFQRKKIPQGIFEKST
jgi:hypothetical protein